MKLTNVIGTVIAALSLAAGGSTVAPTVSPTSALTVGATVAPTPSATPTATPTPTPIATPTPSARPTPAPPVLVLVETCDGSANADNYGSVTFSGDTPGFDFVVYGPGRLGGWAGATTADASGDGTVSDLTADDYEFNNFAPADMPGTLTGSFAIVACPPTPTYSVTQTCAAPGSAQGGSVMITFAGGTPDTVVIDGNTVDVTGNPFTYGPLTVGDHRITVEGFVWPVTITACVSTPHLTVTV